MEVMVRVGGRGSSMVRVVWEASAKGGGEVLKVLRGRYSMLLAKRLQREARQERKVMPCVGVDKTVHPSWQGLQQQQQQQQQQQIGGAARAELPWWVHPKEASERQWRSPQVLDHTVACIALALLCIALACIALALVWHGQVQLLQVLD